MLPPTPPLPPPLKVVLFLLNPASPIYMNKLVFEENEILPEEYPPKQKLFSLYSSQEILKLLSSFIIIDLYPPRAPQHSILYLILAFGVVYT